MIRLRWSDAQPDDASTPIDIRIPAAILATLYLNVTFWMTINSDLWGAGSLVSGALFPLAAMILVPALFFAGPARAVQRSGRPLLALTEACFGSLPAVAVRLCCVLWILCWTAVLFARQLRWMLSPKLDGPFLFPAILVVTLGTSLQTPTVRAKIAIFTSKLAIGILIAAFLRVRDGWPAIATGFIRTPSIEDRWNTLGVLTLLLGPALFLAADFGCRVSGAKPILKLAAFGIALPLFVTVLAVAAINLATGASDRYTPSLQPTVYMAVFSGSARRAQPALLMLLGLTLFGGLRYGGAALAQWTAPHAASRIRYAVLVPCIAAINWFTGQRDELLLPCLQWSATGLTCAAAIVTANYFAPARVPAVRRVDPIAALALFGGLTVAFWLRPSGPPNSWNALWYPYLLPSYAAAFLVCFTLRKLR